MFKDTMISTPPFRAHKDKRTAPDQWSHNQILFFIFFQVLRHVARLPMGSLTHKIGNLLVRVEMKGNPNQITWDLMQSPK